MTVRDPRFRDQEEALLLERSKLLIAEMEKLIERAKVLAAEHKHVVAIIKEKKADKR